MRRNMLMKHECIEIHLLQMHFHTDCIANADTAAARHDPNAKEIQIYFKTIPIFRVLC